MKDLGDCDIFLPRSTDEDIIAATGLLDLLFSSI
jgi:hypothetical protein